MLILFSLFLLDFLLNDIYLDIYHLEVNKNENSKTLQ